MNKIKVVWICHFSNEEVRASLPLSKNGIVDFIKKRVGEKQTKYSDFAPWISNLIKEFEKFTDVELHVIAPHVGLRPSKFSFDKRGVSYHFFRSGLPIPLKQFVQYAFRDRQKLFLSNRIIVKRIIKQINPDIVNLIGTENPYYSITSLDIKNIPVYVSAQTVYTNPLRLKYAGSVDKVRWDLELKIHKKERYYGCGGRMHRDLILRNNPEAIIFKMFFPIQKPPKVKDVPKIYDFVFFAAGVTAKKGIEDALEALALVKEKKADVTLNVVGHCLPDYFNVLQKKIVDLDLVNNISFNDYFPVHTDMHQHIKKSHFALLPVKLDVISGTIIEAMLLELPIISYKTTGTPYLNKNGEIVLLADIGDIEGLANNMLKLLNNPDLAKNMEIDARKFVEKEFDNTRSAMRLCEDYYAVINHYKINKSIPTELLFDVKEFPIYRSIDE